MAFLLHRLVHRILHSNEHSLGESKSGQITEFIGPFVITKHVLLDSQPSEVEPQQPRRTTKHTLCRPRSKGNQFVKSLTVHWFVWFRLRDLPIPPVCDHIHISRINLPSERCHHPDDLILLWHPIRINYQRTDHFSLSVAHRPIFIFIAPSLREIIITRRQTWWGP